jgi:hypothetical protein
MNMLFAIDQNTNEIIVSESPKGSHKINLVERIKREENLIFHNAVVTLSSISSSNELDISLFKAMDKVCQLIYNKHKETK